MREEMIDWLYGLQHFGVKLGLDNIRALLRVLGDPWRSYRSVHIAGTNGKGSVAAMIDAMLAAQGIRAGLFTSPHLVRPHERIRISGRDVDDDELQRRLAELRERIGCGLGDGRLAAHPSFFEVVTAAALQSFAVCGMEAAVLEVGLGGRLDATNAVQADVGAVVSIGMDHVKTLGPTLDRIAGEKAGIVKPGMPVVSGVTQQVAIDVLHDVCRERGAELIDARCATALVSENGRVFDLRTRREDYPDLRLSLRGRHQIDNARIALSAYELLLERLGRKPDPDAVRRGLAAVRWPGRLQWIEASPRLPALLLDGAHNPAGVVCLVDNLRREPRLPEVMVFGMTGGKPADEMLEPLSKIVSRVVLTRPPMDRGIDPAEIAGEARKRFSQVELRPDPLEALDLAAAWTADAGYVLITGSLYLVGHLMEKRDIPLSPSITQDEPTEISP